MRPWLEDRCRYFPILHVLPSDLEALQWLPPTDGAYLCPIVPLQPWLGAHSLAKAIARVRSSIAGKRAHFIADISSKIQPTPGTKRRPVHDELAVLASPDEDCKAWREFIAANDDMIPVIRTPLGLTPDGLMRQIEDFSRLGRGVVLRLHFGSSEYALQSLELAKVVVKGMKNLSDLMIASDFGKITEETLPAAVAINAIQKIALAAGSHDQLNFMTGATSFPSSFSHISGAGSQPILERRLFEMVGASPNLKDIPVNLRYGDYGSARVRERIGGGGDMPARVDYAAKTQWYFNRRDSEAQNDAAYTAAANAITLAPYFEPDLKIYGANVIRAAAGGDVTDLDSQTKVTKVRINLHLHAQAHYFSSHQEFVGGDDGEQPWTD